MSQSIEKKDPVSRNFLSDANWSDVDVNGSVREIEYGGRRGLQALSTKTHMSVTPEHHTLNDETGTLTMWLYPLEDLGYATEYGLFRDHEPDCLVYPIITDHLPLRDLGGASFYITGYAQWWRQLLFRFNRKNDAVGDHTIVGDAGSFHECHGEHAAFGPCDFRFDKAQWYQIGLTWNHSTQEYYLYVNGVRVANGHRWKRQAKDDIGQTLYFGTPAFAIGELNFYAHILEAEDLLSLYKSTGLDSHSGDNYLEAVHAPKSLKTLNRPVDSEYLVEMELSLCEPEHIDAFYIQGYAEAAKISPEGLLVETPDVNHPHDRPSQLYLHTWQNFEGDLDIEFEYKSLKEEGLALLMVHSSGMQREDFMKDYPLRNDPSMSMVHCENVRSYHWEFWREMDGIRTDVSTHALIKNPRLRPLAYQAMPGLLSQDTWHTVRLIQDGGRLIGAVDEQVVFDVVDNPRDGSGPTYNFGHVSLRNMFKSKALWRNLSIRVRPPRYSNESSKE